jgi:hypothetical protein
MNEKHRFGIQGKNNLFSTLTFSPKCIEEVILHEGLVATWMETFYKAKQQSKY